MGKIKQLRAATVGLVLAGFGVLTGFGISPAAFGQSPASGQGGVSMDLLTRPHDKIEAYSLASVSAVAGALGFAVSTALVEGQYPLVLLNAGQSGVRVVVQPLDCTGQDPSKDTCNALLLVGLFRGGLGFPGISLGQINRFNDVQFYARGHYEAGTFDGDFGLGSAIVSRLILSDYGTTRGNLGVELNSFRLSLLSFARFVSQNRMGTMAAGPAQSLVSPQQSPGPAAQAGVPALMGLWQRTGILDEMALRSFEAADQVAD